MWLSRLSHRTWGNSSVRLLKGQAECRSWARMRRLRCPLLAKSWEIRSPGQNERCFKLSRLSGLWVTAPTNPEGPGRMSVVGPDAAAPLSFTGQELGDPISRAEREMFQTLSPVRVVGYSPNQP